MRLVFFIFFVLYSTLSVSISAQLILEDSIKKLQEVAVYGKQVQFQLPGSRIIVPDTGAHNFYGQRALTDLLSTQPSINMKSYGNNMLSTIAFRGTSASQTSVIWNNFSINNYTLGQTDFSTIPLAIIDEVTLLPGGGSTFGGSGAIGGTVALGNRLIYKKNIKAGLTQSYGSFNTWRTSAILRLSNDKLSSSTKIYRNTSENNFKQLSTGERQEQAGFNSYGIFQQLGYKINNAQKIEAGFWYNHNFRQIQPALGAAFSNRDLEDNNLKATLGYQFNKSGIQWQIGTGYFQDLQIFRDGQSIATYDVERIESFAAFTKYFGNAHFLETELRANNIRALSPSYQMGSALESRYSALIKFGGELVNRLDYTFHLRQQFITDTDELPLAAHAGLAYKLVENDVLLTKLKASSALNYRAPTLNDRFWLNAGDPNLLTERGFNNELTLENTISKRRFKNQLVVTAFRNLINNYIQWILNENGSLRPTNVSGVEVMGLEVSNESNFNLPNTGALSFRLSYAYNASTVIKSQRPFEVGNQLIYVPFHKASVLARYTFGRFSINYFINATGRVFTTVQNSEAFALANYQLHDVGLNYQWKSLTTSVRVNNLTNTNYATFFGYAMPGRNYELTLNYTLNKTNK